MDRFSGVLMPIFSLPSPYGIGCFSKEAYDFVLWLKSAGQSLWQVLPMGPTGYGDSPYQSFSAFAGNPYFIDLEELIAEGVLEKTECDNAGFRDGGIDYGKLYEKRFSLLYKAYVQSDVGADAGYRRFVSENEDWLCDYALFMACKEHYGGKELMLWEEPIRNRDTRALSEIAESYADRIGFYKYLQYKFFSQWKRLKQFANENGVKIIGDIPIYTAMDSSDVWTHPELFDIKNGKPQNVAGCPPDGFSPDGQLWGNPVYRWTEHEQTGYSGWIKRLRRCFLMYDVVRIDHFRGFDEFYSIPYGADTARTGVWRKGPGKKLFSSVGDALGRREIIAEDLGFITDSVKKLVLDCGFYGMKIFQFAFDERDGGGEAYLPHNYPYGCTVYTGTHDNETLSAWIDGLSACEEKLLRDYLCDYYTPRDELALPIICSILKSPAKYGIIPIADWLGAKTRINTPSTLGTNWRYRVKGEDLTAELADTIKNISKRYGRI